MVVTSLAVSRITKGMLDVWDCYPRALLISRVYVVDKKMLKDPKLPSEEVGYRKGLLLPPRTLVSTGSQ